MRRIPGHRLATGAVPYGRASYGCSPLCDSCHEDNATPKKATKQTRYRHRRAEALGKVEETLAAAKAARELVQAAAAGEGREWILVAGYRRVAAAEKVGLETVPAAWPGPASSSTRWPSSRRSAWSPLTC